QGREDKPQPPQMLAPQEEPPQKQVSQETSVAGISHGGGGQTSPQEAKIDRAPHLSPISTRSAPHIRNDMQEGPASSTIKKVETSQRVQNGIAPLDHKEIVPQKAQGPTQKSPSSLASQSKKIAQQKTKKTSSPNKFGKKYHQEDPVQK